MIKAQVITKWVQRDVDGQLTNEAAITTLLQAGDSAMDVTGQAAANIIPDPNATVWEVWIADGNTTLDVIKADHDHAVLWSEEVKINGDY